MAKRKNSGNTQRPKNPTRPTRMKSRRGKTSRRVWKGGKCV